jgi:N-methylhydantoinase A/oxoprolinase/acetone carboxylase beta subunit
LVRERRTLADVGYVGQSHFIEVPLDLDARDPLSGLYANFEAAHERLNGHKTGAPAKIVNLRTVHIAWLPKIAVGGTPGRQAGAARIGERSVLFTGETTPCRSAIYERGKLAAGERIVGPAVIEQEDSTTLVPPGWQATVVAGAALEMERIS